jgi:transcriptional regulator with XRE-family HTH domain
MGPRLNPDGAKIRALRIQRGWTQEQLAEIAGVSSRTIQRAEATGCAAFETLRALGGAFEVDFDQLLKTETRTVHDPKSQPMPRPAPLAAPDPEARGTTSLSRPPLFIRRTWTTLRVAVATLATGVLTLAVITYRLDPPSASRFSAPQPSSAALRQSEVRFETPHADTGREQVPRVPQAVPSPATEPPIHDRMIEPERQSPGKQLSAGSPAEMLHLASLASQTAVPLLPEPAALDLLPRPQELPVDFSVLEMPNGWNSSYTAPGVLTQSDQGTGVVRQAVGQAASKAGGAFTKVGASMRRVF